jgi:hypothetical protein
MQPNILKLLKQAVAEQRCLAVRYRDGGVRVVEPHAAYTNDRNEIVVDCYQTDGFSASGRQPPFWKRLRLKKITAASLLKQTFEPRVEEGFSPEKSRYKNEPVAIIVDDKPSYMYSPEALQQMGPFLPDDRKFH